MKKNIKQSELKDDENEVESTLEPSIMSKSLINKNIKRLEAGIDSIYVKYEISIGTSTQHLVKMGRKFRRLKWLVSDKNKGWKDYLLKRFPHIHIRNVQRYMKVSRGVNLKRYPALGYLPMDTLLTLAEWFKRLFDEKSIGRGLIERGVDPRIVDETADSIGHFKNDVDDVIKDCQSGSMWIPGDETYYSSPSLTKEINRKRQKIQRRIDKQQKRLGKVDVSKLEHRTNGAASRLSTNIALILEDDLLDWDSKKIIRKKDRPIRLCHDTFTHLQDRLSELMKKTQYFDENLDDV